jgi:hypothetical protein
MGRVRVPTRVKKGLLFIVNLHQRRRYGEVWILGSLCLVPILGQVGMIRSRMGTWDGARKKRILYINAYVTNSFYRTNLTWYQHVYEYTAADDLIACDTFGPLRC